MPETIPKATQFNRNTRTKNSFLLSAYLFTGTAASNGPSRLVSVTHLPPLFTLHHPCCLAQAGNNLCSCHTGTETRPVNLFRTNLDLCIYISPVSHLVPSVFRSPNTRALTTSRCFLNSPTSRRRALPTPKTKQSVIPSSSRSAVQLTRLPKSLSLSLAHSLKSA